MKPIGLLATWLFAALIGSASAQAPASPDQRLREQIKSLTMQLRTAETERATLQVEKTSLADKIKTLEKQVEEITKQMAADKDAAKIESEKQRAEIAAKESEIVSTKDLLVKADNFGKQSADFAKKTEAERAKLAGENLQLKRTVADQRVRNAKMHEIGTEILSRYEKFGLGTAITAREPFVGITRARLEALVEDYSGQLTAQRIRMDGTSPKPAPAPDTPGSDRPSDGAPAQKKRGAKP